LRVLNVYGAKPLIRMLVPAPLQMVTEQIMPHSIAPGNIFPCMLQSV